MFDRNYFYLYVFSFYRVKSGQAVSNDNISGYLPSGRSWSSLQLSLVTCLWLYEIRNLHSIAHSPDTRIGREILPTACSLRATLPSRPALSCYPFHQLYSLRRSIACVCVKSGVERGQV